MLILELTMKVSWFKKKEKYFFIYPKSVFGFEKNVNVNIKSSGEIHNLPNPMDDVMASFIVSSKDASLMCIGMVRVKAQTEVTGKQAQPSTQSFLKYMPMGKSKPSKGSCSHPVRNRQTSVSLTTDESKTYYLYPTVTYKTTIHQKLTVGCRAHNKSVSG